MKKFFTQSFIALIGGLSGASADTKVFDFAADAAGQPAAGFSCARTGTGREGAWRVVADTIDGSPKKALAQTDADGVDARFPLCVRDDLTAANADISVKFRPMSGSVDQAAGVIWRYTDANNYYLVRANALEDNVVLYKVQNGRRADLPLVGKGKTYGAKAPVPKKQWSTLRVTVEGNTFTVQLNGVELFAVQDSTFTQAGRIGVWTKADSVTYFSDLRIVTP